MKKYISLKENKPPIKILLNLFLLFLLASGCSSHRFVAPEKPADDRRPVPQPVSREINLAGDNVAKIGRLQISRLFDLSRHIRSIAGKPREAKNTDAFDNVFESSWFTNRNAADKMSIDDIAKGPNNSNGPNMTGKWEIVRAKSQGVTPGFTIKDTDGNLYVIKFDPKNSPELSTGAELVSTKLFHAAGYNVPENYLVKFDPKILHLGDEVNLTDREGKKRFMNSDDLEEILSRVHHESENQIRAVASKYLPGVPMGSFYYEKVRKDDFNDVIPHEHRRELRGLRWIASWLNHYDTKANNTLDMYDPAGYVKHYLIDFGSTLGSQGDEPMPPEIGREGILDPGQVVKVVGSLGAYKRPWEMRPEIQYPAVGFFISDDFNPTKYKYILPNPAFGNATDRDGYWGAKVVMSFSDEQIETAVAQGGYSNPEAAAYLTKTIIERRDIIGKLWFTKMAPLDFFNLNENLLTFRDLAIETGLGNASETNYYASIFKDNSVVKKDIGLKNTLEFSLTEFQSIAKQSPDGEWRIDFILKRGSKSWKKKVSVYLEWNQSDQVFELLGLRR